MEEELEKLFISIAVRWEKYRETQDQRDFLSYEESKKKTVKLIKDTITSELTSLLQDIVGKKTDNQYEISVVSLEDIQKIGEEWGLTIPTESPD